MTSKNHRTHILFSTIQFKGDKVSHPSAVKNTCLADYSVRLEARYFLHVVRHQIEWVCDNDNNTIRSMVTNTCPDLSYNFSVFTNQILSCHSWLTWEATGYNHNIRTRYVLIIGCPCNSTVVIQDVCILTHVERLSFGKALVNVEQYNVRYLHVGQYKRTCCSNITRTNYRNFSTPS